MSVRRCRVGCRQVSQLERLADGDVTVRGIHAPGDDLTVRVRVEQQAVSVCCHWKEQ